MVANGPADGERLDVGVVIVTYNSAAVLEGLIRSLPAGLAGLSARTIVVDNASHDDSVEIARRAAVEALALETNTGYAAAINRGMHELRDARAILVLNADIELTPGCVAVMLGVLGQREVGIVAPRTYFWDDPAVVGLTQRRDPSLLRAWATALLGADIATRVGRLSEIVADPAQYESPRDVDWASGAALLISRDSAIAVGDWDETFFLYSEETDYCWRARRAGSAVRYTPDASITHRGGDGVMIPKQRAMMSVNRVRLYRRRHRPVAAWAFFAACIVHELVRAATGDENARAAVGALVSPRRRPPELRSSSSLLPH